MPEWAPYAALDYLGVFFFGATGALAAAQKKHDIVTFVFFAAMTGVGGGALRDLLIGAPVFWVADQTYLGVCVAAAVAVWVLAGRVAHLRVLLWMDAVGLAAYAVVGANKAAAFGAPPIVAIAMGALTATFGGVLRDIVAGEASILLRREIYVTAALAGAAAFVLGAAVGLANVPAQLLGFTLGLAVRAGALTFGWALPGYSRNATPNRE